MSIQLTGMSSGLDTEAMIAELVKVSSAKKTKLEGEQKKLSWKQDAWKELNTKITDFYNKQIEPMKWESAYLSKKTTSADESIVSVVSSDGAVDGSQSVAVTQLAKTGYLTGGQLSGATKSSTMASLGVLKDGESGSFTINGKSINISSSTTISSLISQMNNAGVSASFDEKNQRIFVSAKESGEKNDFNISADNAKGLEIVSKLGLMSKEDALNPTYTKYANMSAEDKADEIAKRAQALADKYYKSTQSLLKANEDLQKAIDDTKSELDAYKESDDYKNALAAAGKDNDADAIAALEEKITDLVKPADDASDDDKKAYEDQLKELNDQKAAIQKKVDLEEKIEKTQSTIDANNNTIANNESYYTATTAPDAEGNDVTTVVPTTKATEEATKTVEDQIKAAKDAIDQAKNMGSSATGAVRVKGADAKILLNGAEFTSSNNSFTVNGLSITAKNVSEKDSNGDYKTTELTTATDVDGIYDKIVSFFKEYNDILSSMQKLYNAESASKYQMLTSEQKEAMTDDEVKDWEDKIKSALLRRDENVDTLSNLFINTMAKGYEVNGKKYTLSDFGIETLSYFLSADNEKSNLHINGNKDDKDTKDAPDKLKAMIASDPKAVSGFFSKLISSFYNDMYAQAKSNDFRTRNNFYDDKLLKSNYDSYNTKIKTEQTKLDNMEKRYRKQFTAMEKAMSNMNSQSSYLSGLFGGGK